MITIGYVNEKKNIKKMIHVPTLKLYSVKEYFFSPSD
jgi:hypothetical protein